MTQSTSEEAGQLLCSTLTVGLWCSAVTFGVFQRLQIYKSVLMCPRGLCCETTGLALYWTVAATAAPPDQVAVVLCCSLSVRIRDSVYFASKLTQKWFDCLHSLILLGHPN